MLHANLSPMNPRTMQRHNCIQQALEAAGVGKIPKEYAREEKENEVRRRWTVLGGQVAKKQHIKSFSMGPA